MSENLHKIQDNPNLFRDPSTGAVINKDASGYESYIRTYKKMQNQEKDLEKLKTSVESLTTDISDIKNLLSQLIKEKNHGD